MRSRTKQYIALALAIPMSLGLWFLILASATSESLPLAILAGIFTVIWVAYLAVILAVMTERLVIVGTVIGIPLTVVAIAYQSLTAIGAAILMVFIISVSYVRMRREILGRIKYQTIPVFRQGVSLLTLAFLIAVIGVLVPHFSKNLDDNDLLFQIPEETVGIMLRPLDGVLGGLLPGYTQESSINELVSRSISHRIQGAVVPPTVVESQNTEVRTTLSRYTGQAVSGRETVPGLVASTINNQVTRTLQQNPLIATLVSISIALIIARIVIPLITWPALGIIAAIVNVGRRAHILRLAQIPGTIEQLQI